MYGNHNKKEWSEVLVYINEKYNINNPIIMYRPREIQFGRDNKSN